MIRSAQEIQQVTTAIEVEPPKPPMSHDKKDNNGLLGTILLNPIGVLCSTGIFLVILGMLGAKSITMPLTKLKIVFNVDKKIERGLRIAVFLFGIFCFSAGMTLWILPK